MSAPGVRLERDSVDGRWMLRQRRPRIAAALKGLPFCDALDRVPLLLPLCDVAQASAAGAALEALGVRDAGRSVASADRLLREQGASIAWRFLITWPALIGRRPNPEALRGLRATLDSAALASQLEELTPGLAQVKCVSGLKDWARAGNCTAAEVLRRVLEPAPREALKPVESRPGDHAKQGSIALSALCLMREADLWQLLCADMDGTNDGAQTISALSRPPPEILEVSKDGTPRHTQESAAMDARPIYVGPLAAARHPLVCDVAADPSLDCAAKLLIAQVLDTIAVISALRSNLASERPAATGQRIDLADGESVGVGVSTTVRGPVFHVVRQDEEAAARGVASDWTILAPTDWHFADAELLRAILSRSASKEDAVWALAALDPCCESSVRSGPGTGQPEHA